MNVVDRFLTYVKIDTQSSEESASYPSTEKQKDLARVLTKELEELGLEQVYMDQEYGYVYGRIPSTDGGARDKVIAFLAHMDTSPETSGKDVKPRIVENYHGQNIVLNQELNIVLETDKYPEILNYKGKSLIVTDGTTLLGADDKAGVAEIMTMAQELMAHPEWEHGEIAICFTPDEEVGGGVDHIDLERLAAHVAYTVDGGGIGELEYECFNAAAGQVTIHGTTVHPGEAKGKMKNAIAIAMEYEQMLPPAQKAEYTSGYEGFIHMTDIEGHTEETRMNYLVRDHDRDSFEKMKHTMIAIRDFLNMKYGEGTVEVEITDNYYNMKEKIVPDHYYVVERAKKAMEELGIEPKIQPIRGGTDGARLSYMGLPCPNLCTGGHNYHGRYEYVCVESMEQVVEILKKVAMS